MPLPKIEQPVMPFMGGADYLGPEFRGDTYRLKFMRGGRVIWVDVDAATGRILGRSSANRFAIARLTFRPHLPVERRWLASRTSFVADKQPFSFTRVESGETA